MPENGPAVGIARRAFWIGPLEVEWRRLEGHVRFDPGRITYPDKGKAGGVLALRVTRKWGVEAVLWWRPMYRIGGALNAAMWRWENWKADRRDA